ncbi:MAG: PKD domain-containing protein [Methanosarcina sp.]
MCLTETALAKDIQTGQVSGFSLNSEGATYVLKGDIVANRTAFSIEADNLIFDGNGHKIDCGLTGSGVGILSNSYRNITIKNVKVVQHNSKIDSHGISLQNTAHIRISNCSASSIAGSGIYVTGSSATIDQCKTLSITGKSLYLVTKDSRAVNCSAVSDSDYAIYLANSDNNTVSNCTGYSNTSCGIGFIKSNNNKVSNCTGYSNTSHGLSFVKCTNNEIHTSNGYTDSSNKGSGINLMDASNNIFVNSEGASYLRSGIHLNNLTKYNIFINCIGDSFGNNSIYRGIWFTFPADTCSGTNIYKSCTSRSKLATTSNNPKATTLLAMGDSITAGGAAGLPYGAYIYYANLTLGNRGYIFYNAGIGGETSASGKIRFLDEMALFRPEYVTIMYGANDLKIARSQESITDDILWMATQAKAKGATPVILLTSVRRGSEKNTTSLNKNLSAQALEAGYCVFNVYDIIDTIPNNGKYDAYNATNYVDSVHPTQAANKLIGEALAEYIVTLSNKEKAYPFANFTVNVSSGDVPLCVQLTDLSENATGYNWDFGDGNYSTAKNPIHLYTKEGNYTIKLIASNELGDNTTKKPDYIILRTTVNATIPKLSFWGSRVSGTAPLTIRFTDASTGKPTEWKWDFGDRTYSTAQKPKHTYSKAGNYTVTLKASNTAGTGAKTRIDYIKVKAPV